jgi:hypothetical protein
MSTYNDFSSRKSEELGDVSQLKREQFGTLEQIEASREENGVDSGVRANASASVKV